MIRGIYTAASGMSTQLRAQEIISNNLANADTTGFKRDVSVKKSFPEMLISRINDSQDKHGPVAIGKMGTGSSIDGSYTDFQQGAVYGTENKLDLAILGDGFFTVMTPAGQMYTRDGSFTLDQSGQMVTKDGYALLGSRGPITVGAGDDLVVNRDGSVAVNGEIVNQLRIVEGKDSSSLIKVGQNLYSAQGQGVVGKEDANVVQAHLEASNINVVNEMVNMISGLRMYETGQKAVQMQDEALSRLITVAGGI